MLESNITQKPRTVRIGIIGDFDAQLPYHKATIDALYHAANALSISCDCIWIPTERLASRAAPTVLEPFDALWCAPGSPYKSMEGALRGIRYARENHVPFLGT